MAEAVANSEIDRVGQKLRVDAVSIECASGGSAKYEAAVKLVAEKAPGAALILNCKDAGTIEAAVKAVADRKPLTSLAVRVVCRPQDRPVRGGAARRAKGPEEGERK